MIIFLPSFLLLVLLLSYGLSTVGFIIFFVNLRCKLKNLMAISGREAFGKSWGYVLENLEA